MLKRERPKEELPGEVTGVGGAFWLAVAAERLWYLVQQQIK